MEDDERFNAGTGSNLRLDGQTIEMDAAVMNSQGRFGGVACIRRVKNPVLVVRKVLDTPHLLLCSEGAESYARLHGFPDHDPTTERAREKYRLARMRMNAGTFDEERPEWRRFDLGAHWNFPSQPDDEEAGDTIGAVVRDEHGRFAVANSTGGVTHMLLGRIGDSPLLGAGLFAGRYGAVAATGLGEEITMQLLSKTVYEWIQAEMPVCEACRRGIDLYPKQIPVGLIAVTAGGLCAMSNRDMAWASMEE
jgi:L-asparaginase/beta-aspartyl-peptidase (threonine type)